MKLSILWPTYGNSIRMGGATSRMGGATSFPYPALPLRFKSLLNATGKAVRKNAGASKNFHVKLNHLHMHQGSPLLPLFRALSRSIHRHPSADKATFTPSIKPNLRVPRVRPQLTSHSILAIRYSSILSMCLNHFNTLWSAVQGLGCTRQLHFYASSPTHLLIPDSIHSWH